MKTFEELGVSPEIRKAIEEMGYENPMPVQEEVIPYLLGENNDVVALAQTGTGKTAAFAHGIFSKYIYQNHCASFATCKPYAWNPLVLLKKVYALTTRMFCGPWKPATVTAISTA